MKEKLKAYLRLIETKELSITKSYQLLQTLGCAETFVGKGIDALKSCDNIPFEVKKKIAAEKDPDNWSQIADLTDRFEIKIVSILDEEYPQALKHIFNPPLILFYRGTLPQADENRLLAIVGTRKPDNYGILMTKRLTSHLARAGFGIVSGLAYGIDTQAHLETLNSGGLTYAVMATGCDQIYPNRNRKLADKIIEEGGALISEFVPGSKPEKWNFPTRNRIISGLSRGTLVIQGPKNSGALLTAKYALDQNRDLFALPGDINRRESEGPNYLIKLGAKIVTSPEDILEEYDLILSQERVRVPELSPNEQKIWRIIQDNKPSIHYDNLVDKSGFTVGVLSPVLLNLELKNLIRVGDGTMISSVD